MNHLALIALDLANEQARDLDHRRLVAEARAGRPARTPFPRRALATPWRSSAAAAPPRSAGSTKASPTTSAARSPRPSRLTV